MISKCKDWIDPISSVERDVLTSLLWKKDFGWMAFLRREGSGVRRGWGDGVES